MGRFRYRMQNILNIKEKLETQAKNDFAAANLELLEEQDKLAKMLEHNRELEEESKRLRLKDSLSIKEIKDNTLSIELQKEKMKQQALCIHAAEKKVEQKRKVMVDLMQEKKTHELLKEKAFAQFLLDEKAEESKQIDELTSYTYGQK